ncbi:MAG TPA: OmpH family outer membrane protein [Bryobacteraceae bacterium]
MTKTVLAISGLALTMLSGVPALAQQKIGVVQVQSAIVGTKEGQKAASDLETKMAPKRKELEGKQAELRKLQESLQKGGSVMNEQARAQLAREIDDKNKDYKRALEDAQSEFQGEQDRILNDLGAKLMAVINKYAKDNGYSLVIDVSNPQTPVMYASDTIDITKQVIDLYDKNSGASAPTAAPAPVKPAAAVPPTKK